MMKTPFKTFRPCRRPVLWVLFAILVSIQPLWQQQVDSLERVLNRPDITTEDKIHTLYMLSRDLAFVDRLQALEYADESLELATQAEDRRGMAYAYRILGSIYSLDENYFTSMQYIHLAHELFVQQEDSAGIANCYVSMGHIYRNLNEREKEERFHRLSYDLFKKLGQPERTAVAAHNMGETYYLNGQLEKARAYTREAIEILSGISHAALTSSCYKVMGLIHLKEQDYQEAKRYFQKALDISEGLGKDAQKIASAESLIRLAEISGILGNPSREKAYLEQAAKLSQENNLYDYQVRSYYQLALHYARTDDVENTRRFMVRHKELSDSLQVILTNDRARLTQGMIHIEQLTKKTEELEEQAAQQALALEIRNRTLILIGVFLIILSLLIYKLFRTLREMREKNSIIQMQKEELAELNASKDRFFSIVAHDLRSPLGSLKSFTTLLADHIDLMSLEEIKEMGVQLDRSVDNTMQLTDNLITWARSQMNEIKTEATEFDLRPLVENVHTVFASVARHKQITMEVSYPEETTIFGDKNQIEFVIRNLVNNAIKYTREGGTVKLEVLPADDQKAVIRISDNGVGMDPDQVASLFIRQSDKSRRGTAGEKGSGLGLVLSHEFVKRNKGRIRVESIPDKGTCFTMEFRRTRQAA